MTRSSTLEAIRALIIDIDGVVWQGRQALPGVNVFFEMLSQRGIAFIIASNNSARPSSDIVERLAEIGVHVQPSQVLTSAEATARYLPRIVAPGARVFVMGGKGITNALANAGYILADENVDVVVAGIDRTLSYDKLKRATTEIRRGAKFIGTNGDKTFPTEEGLVPGAGAILAALEAATDVTPIVIGKPARAMFDIALEHMKVDRSVAAMLGDRLDTDIEGAERAGLKTILVLTGVTSREMLPQSSVKPNFVFENLEELVREWNSA